MHTRIARLLALAVVLPGTVVVLNMVTAGPAAASVCTGRVAGDVNGDGKPDVVVGQSGLKVGSFDEVGAASVLRGGPDGLTTSGNQLLQFSDPPVTDGPNNGDQFGYSAAVGFFDGDCDADVAVGSPDDYLYRGSVTLYRGSSTGLQVIGRVPGQDLNPAAGLAGYSLAVGDFNHDGYDDLAIGAMTSTTGGGVVVLYGSSTGLKTTKPVFFTQDSANVPGSGEDGDYWGWSLAAGDFNGDHYADLAVGNPTESVSGVRHAGDVTILYGTSSGLSGTNSALFDESTADVPGTAEEEDQFGVSLAAGDVTGDGNDDLIVGVPLEGIGSVRQAGCVYLLKGSASGITAAGSQEWDQDSTGMPDTSVTGDYFGQSVAVGDFNGDHKADVAIGVPGEDLWAGAVDEVFGTASGLTGSGAQALSQDTAGVPGAVEEGDWFGWAVSVASLTGAAHPDLVVGVPFENGGDGAIDVLLSSSSGLTGIGSQAFSASALVGGANTTADFGYSLS